jgi:hypothetical protein
MFGGMSTRVHAVVGCAAVVLLLSACGPSQDTFAEEFSRDWCKLAVECNHPSPPTQWDLSSVEACQNEVATFLKNIDGDNCSYDSDRGQDALDRVQGASCATYEADPGGLWYPSAFPCDHAT